MTDSPSPDSTYLPAPFAWCHIPAGQVTIQRGGALRDHTPFDVAAFWMSKYPVTNAQYARFIADGGYATPDYWTETGWQVRQAEDRTAPDGWQAGLAADAADYPVIGVCWYEAMAFAQWLSTVTEQPVHLPTEQQWQRAAQGDENRAYPWGDTWDASRCNLGGKELAPVTAYAGQGDSPFGVVDLVGNAFEWCRNEYHLSPHAERRAARGGAYFNVPDEVRCDYRNFADPVHQLSTFGFRLMCAL